MQNISVSNREIRQRIKAERKIYQIVEEADVVGCDLERMDLAHFVRRHSGNVFPEQGEGFVQLAGTVAFSEVGASALRRQFVQRLKAFQTLFR